RGVMVILIREMKASPSGFNSAACAGNRAPASAPRTAPAATSTYGSRQSGLLRRPAESCGTDGESGVAAICKLMSSRERRPCTVALFFFDFYIGPVASPALMPYRHDLRTNRYHGPDLARGFPRHSR